MIGCSWCRLVPQENEPRLVPFVLGRVNAYICACCADEVSASATKRMARIKHQAERDDLRALRLAERIRIDEEAAAARLREAEARAVEKQQAEAAALARSHDAETRRERLEGARILQGRLVRGGLDLATARMRAAATFGLRSDDLEGERAA